MSALRRQLGRLASPDDSRTLRLATYMRDLPAPPPSCDYDEALPLATPMFANDRIGDCGIVAPVSLAMTWCAQNGETFSPSMRDVIASYSAVNGYATTNPDAPETNDTDRGCDMLSVCKRWRKEGIAGKAILAFVKIDTSDITQVKTAIHLFGGVYVGANLPKSAQVNAPWTRRAGDGDDKPGSWGGHAMGLAAFDRFGGWFRTWGRRQRFSWPWWIGCVDEAYAAVSVDFVGRTTGLAPNGLDLSALRADLQSIA